MEDKEINAFDKAFGLSLIGINEETLEDLGEIGIDSLLENDSLIEQIPILKVGVSACKTAVGIRDRILFQKTINFIKEFNNGTISKSNLENHRKKINDDKKLYKEYSYVIRLIDLVSDKFHAEMLAKFYRSYILEEINWDQFCELSEANRRMFVSDCKLLKRIGYIKREKTIADDEESSVNRLYSLGLIIDERSHSHINQLTYTIVGEDGNEEERTPREEDAVILTKLGKLFCKYLDI